MLNPVGESWSGTAARAGQLGQTSGGSPQMCTPSKQKALPGRSAAVCGASHAAYTVRKAEQALAGVSALRIYKYTLPRWQA